jgi:DMSO/TMAO reductase YedYZ molybdopterin-dependent catalytic subunit
MYGVKRRSISPEPGSTCRARRLLSRAYNRRTATEQNIDPAELPGVGASEALTPAELQLATRNHGLPLEALAYDLTPAGLHYLLIHYDVPVVDPAGWRLTVGGRVANELSLSLDELRERPAGTLAVTMECAGNGRARLEPRPISQPWLLEAVGNAEWTGVRLADLLDEAGVQGGAVEVLFRGLDRGVEGGEEQQYERSLTLAEARRDEILLAHSMNGQPLPPQHGFPLRLIVPGWYGMTSVKWLEAITVLDRPFEGYQQARGYRFRQSPDEDGVPVDRIQPRSLMVPPGIPEFATRARHLEPGPTTVRGRAWSGRGTIARVEVSVDGGATWADARLGSQPSRWSWVGWEWDWDANEPGDYEVCCRATDSDGNEQPLDAPWNLGGYANNEVQRVSVTVA